MNKEHNFIKIYYTDFDDLVDGCDYYERYKCLVCGMLEGRHYNKKNKKTPLIIIPYTKNNGVYITLEKLTCNEFILKTIL